MTKISLIIPCYNEEESIPYLTVELNRLMKKMNYVDFEVIMIDNCSNDNTLKLLKDLNKKDKKYKYISFSRNFGKDSSMYAGLENCTGDYAAILDADLQDPPELIIKMYDLIKNGEYDCIATYRENRKGEPWLRSFLANSFYKVINKLSDYEIKSGARDFRLMNRKMIDAILELNEVERFTKGIFSWVGFNVKWISFENHERVAGKTKLPMKSATNYAIRGIVSFSTVPLKLASIVGFIFCLAAIIYILYVIINYLFNGSHIAPGYSSLMCVVLLGFGLTLLVLGIIGQYIAQMYNEVKNRPKYIINECSSGIKKM